MLESSMDRCLIVGSDDWQDNAQGRDEAYAKSKQRRRVTRQSSNGEMPFTGAMRRANSLLSRSTRAIAREGQEVVGARVDRAYRSCARSFWPGTRVA